MTMRVTVIGSGDDVDVRLAGLEDRHAEIRRDDADEYVYVHLAPEGSSSVNGAAVGERALHTGDRIQLGSWTLSFSRDEFADHGRPYGGREGGEFAYQRQQRRPRARGTTPAGGSSRTGEDPGEYV